MDNIRKQLIENYEDALFALLMDDYALSEGERLLAENEALKANPPEDFPEDMEIRGLKRIKKTFRKKRARAVLRTTGKIVPRLAATFGVFALVCSGLFFTVEAFRLDVLNMALEYHETHTSVQFTRGTTSSAAYTAEDLQRVLPEDFEMTSYEVLEHGELAEFSAPNGARIVWYVDFIDVLNNLDTEDADYSQKITIASCDGMLVEKEGISTIVWGDNATKTMYRIVGDMPKEELLELAEHLTE